VVYEVFTSATDKLSQHLYESGEKIAQAKEKPQNLQGEHPKDQEACQKQDSIAKKPHHLSDHPKPSL
jgi:hypothetical protein